MDIKITMRNNNLYAYTIHEDEEHPVEMFVGKQSNDNLWHIYVKSHGDKKRLCETDSDESNIAMGTLSSVNCDVCQEACDDMEESLVKAWRSFFPEMINDSFAEEGAKASIRTLFGHKMTYTQYLNTDKEGNVSIESVAEKIDLVDTGETIMGNPIYRVAKKNTNDDDESLLSEETLAKLASENFPVIENDKKEEDEDT